MSKSTFKEYAIGNERDVYGKILLRETAAYLISDSGKKYKKIDGSNGCIAMHSSGSGWNRSVSRIYPLDCNYVKECLEKHRQKSYVFKISDHLQKLSRSQLTYEQAVEIADKLGLEVK